MKRTFGERHQVDEMESLEAGCNETRRRFLARRVAKMVGSFLAGAGAAQLVTGRRIAAQLRSGPDAALQELLEGNKRYTAGRLTADKQDLASLRKSTAEKQQPFAAVLSCADSRVPVEIIFDQNIGQVFVTRVAGNVITPEIIASLEYGAAVLGTKAILVLGHSNCGAVKATVQGEAVPGQISTLYQHIQPAVERAGPDLEAVSKANARIQSALLREASTVIAGLVKENKLTVAAGYYDVAKGNVALLEAVKG